MERNKNESNFRYGTLPGASAPLAIAYVPMQTSATPAYEAAEALSRGTLACRDYFFGEDIGAPGFDGVTVIYL